MGKLTTTKARTRVHHFHIYHSNNNKLIYSYSFKREERTFISFSIYITEKKMRSHEAPVARLQQQHCSIISRRERKARRSQRGSFSCISTLNGGTSHLCCRKPQCYPLRPSGEVTTGRQISQGSYINGTTEPIVHCDSSHACRSPETRRVAGPMRHRFSSWGRR